MSKIGFGFCKLLYFAMTSIVWFVRFVTRALPLSIIWYLFFVLILLPIFVYHLVETISSYTFSTERFFMEEL